MADKIVRTLSRRPNNSLDHEREEFLKQMTVAISKAINKEECAVKEKHLRITILGTHKEQGANYFWDNVMRLQIEGNPIVAWKFCHVFHKVMREGHPNVLKDSAKFKTKLKDLGKYWGLLKEGYGRLILHYCKLVLTKLEFHSRNPEVPGNLLLSDAAILALGEGEVNNLYEFAIEALDYLDEILALQRKVFDSMDMSRAQSLTNVGQCRLAPLILCIQDASCLYDYLVKIMFYLHARCPKDTLAGHRERFNAQFKALKQFFYTSSNLQYYKHLVSIPPLPELPPNFMVASDFESYVPPRVTVIGHEDDAESLSSDTLVDFGASPTPSRPVSARAASPPPPDESLQAAVVTSLRHDLDDTKAALLRLRSEFAASLEQAQNRALQLEYELAQARDAQTELGEENDRYRSQAETLQNENNSQTAAKLHESEKKAQTNEDKFRKMKDVYAKLREEHIGVLGKLGEMQKDVEGAKREAADSEDRARANSHRVEALQVEKQQLVQKDSESHGSHAAELSRLETEIAELTKAMSEAETTALAKEMSTGAEAAALEARAEELGAQLGAAQAALKEKADGNLDACVAMLMETVEELEDPAHLSVVCSPEFVLSLMGTVKHGVEEEPGSPGRPGLAHDICHLVSFLKANANAAPTGKGEALAASCSKICTSLLDYYKELKGGSEGSVPLGVVRSELEASESGVRSLLGRMGDVSKEELGGLMEAEMSAMGAAIQAAAAKIAEIAAKSQAQTTGVRLQVNESILAACTALMQAVLLLVSKSRDLQVEIVGQGKGVGSTTEFYKRHHQWTEGLLSAAKNVGLAAHVLVTSADRVIGGEGKLEELMAASQEIAAATAQLVVASKVKAERGSERLVALTTASKSVSAATAAVIGRVKAGRSTLEEEEALDFSKYSIHQSKKMEMESQVKVLELESSLEKERLRLGQLRRNNYHSSDESSKESTPAPAQ